MRALRGDGGLPPDASAEGAAGAGDEGEGSDDVTAGVRNGGAQGGTPPWLRSAEQGLEELEAEGQADGRSETALPEPSAHAHAMESKINLYSVYFHLKYNFHLALFWDLKLPNKILFFCQEFLQYDYSQYQ